MFVYRDLCLTAVVCKWLSGQGAGEWMCGCVFVCVGVSTCGCRCKCIAHPLSLSSDGLMECMVEFGPKSIMTMAGCVSKRVCHRYPGTQVPKYSDSHQIKNNVLHHNQSHYSFYFYFLFQGCTSLEKSKGLSLS